MQRKGDHSQSHRATRQWLRLSVSAVCIDGGFFSPFPEVIASTGQPEWQQMIWGSTQADGRKSCGLAPFSIFLCTRQLAASPYSRRWSAKDRLVKWERNKTIVEPRPLFSSIIRQLVGYVCVFTNSRSPNGLDYTRR